MIEVKKFHAVWCGPCRTLGPVLENVKKKFSNINFEEIDVDKNYEQAEKYYIRSVPTVVIVKDGKEVERFTGLQSEMAYVNAINESLKS
jgi:thioredoxin 1